MRVLMEVKTMKFKVYPSRDEYEKIIWGIFKIFWKNPELFRSLPGKLNPILRDILDSDPELNVKVDLELDKLGRVERQASIIRAIWFLLVWTDGVYKVLQLEHRHDNHKARERAFDKLKVLIGDMESEFVDLVLALWLLKERRGYASFVNYWHSLDEYWDELIEAFPGFFKRPGPSTPKQAIISTAESAASSKPSMSRRRSSMKKKEEKIRV
jgi:hypothetical protein